MSLTLSEKLLLLAAALAGTHHVDHVLRVDHSGWPFLPQVTPFTFSLLVYPLFLLVLLARLKPWYRVFGAAALFLFAMLSHTFLETPADQYRTWAYGSDFPGHEGQHNLLGQDSKLLVVMRGNGDGAFIGDVISGIARLQQRSARRHKRATERDRRLTIVCSGRAEKLEFYHQCPWRSG